MIGKIICFFRGHTGPRMPVSSHPYDQEPAFWLCQRCGEHAGRGALPPCICTERPQVFHCRRLCDRGAPGGLGSRV